MLRSDFENHPLWAVLDACNARANQILDQKDPRDVAAIEAMTFYVSNIRSFRESGAPVSAYFTERMLADMTAVFDGVVSRLDNRIATGDPTYSESAQNQSETSLDLLGPWPKPSTKGARAGQMQTAFEELLETQRKSIETLQASHQKLRDDVQAERTAFEAALASATAEMEGMRIAAADAAATVEAEKLRIDTVVTDGQSAVTKVTKDNDTAFRTWRDKQESAFAERMVPFTEKIEGYLNDAKERLDQLKVVETEYANLSGAAATDKLSSHFKSESQTGRRTGLILYGIGFVFLLAAAVPLAWLVFVPSEHTAFDWNILVPRLAIAVLAGSAATVVIRLGGRFIQDAGVSKRMELEMRTFGPFLENVTDKETVDTARIALVDRAFGKYTGQAATESKDDVIQVSTLSQIVETLAKLVGR